MMGGLLKYLDIHPVSMQVKYHHNLAVLYLSFHVLEVPKYVDIHQVSIQVEYDDNLAVE